MPIPRGLAFAALLWAMACFLATLGGTPPIQPSNAAYTPAVRAMLELMAFGACMLWPIARLATAERPWPPARVALDAATLLVAFHIFFWPLQLVTHWTREQAAAIDAAACGWIAVAGAWLAVALRSPGRSAAWGLGWLVTAGAGAFLDVAGAPAGLACAAGPFAAILRLAPAAGDATRSPAWEIALWPWALAAVGWAAAAWRSRAAPPLAPRSTAR